MLYGYGTDFFLSLHHINSEAGMMVRNENIRAAKAIADEIKTCLGPKEILKMLMDPMIGFVMSKNGSTVLREIPVQHPAARSMINIAKTQGEEIGDGTISVVLLVGEILAIAEHFLVNGIHPVVVVRAYRQALEDITAVLNDKLSLELDWTDRKKFAETVKSCVRTKFIGNCSDIACEIALDAVHTIMLEEQGRREIDIKRYVKLEKIRGGSIGDSSVFRGVMVKKDVTHPKMRRLIKNPRIVLLNCSLEYKKAESPTNIEVTKETDFTEALETEEESVKKMCEDIIALKPDVVFTEKGISDLAQQYLVEANISAVCNLRKTDVNRIAGACGANIVNRTDELREEDVGTGAGLFEIKKHGVKNFCFITECKGSRACTILLRGTTKDVLNETESHLNEALHVARNLLMEPKLVPGGGAVEVAVARFIREKAENLAEAEQWPYRSIAGALEIIPKTLAENCGEKADYSLSELHAKHRAGSSTWGIDGETGVLADMKVRGIWEPLAVKLQTYKTAIETTILLLRMDNIVYESKKKDLDIFVTQQTQATEESTEK